MVATLRVSQPAYPLFVHLPMAPMDDAQGDAQGDAQWQR